jgi:hypothetical protein
MKTKPLLRWLRCFGLLLLLAGGGLALPQSASGSFLPDAWVGAGLQALPGKGLEPVWGEFASRRFVYNRHRYYDPATGRFISKDPIGLEGGLNAFQYAPNPTGWIDPLGLKCVTARKASLREIQRQLGIAMSQQPIKQEMVPLTNSDKSWILDRNKQPIMTRELTYQVGGKNVVIQDHSAGHYYKDGVGDQPSHHNVRPDDNTRTGSVDGMDDHYYFDCRNKK